MENPSLSPKMYNRLHSHLRIALAKSGSFTRTPQFELRNLAILVLVFALGFIGLLFEPPWMTRLVLLLALAYASVHAGLIAHEASHRNIS